MLGQIAEACNHIALNWGKQMLRLTIRSLRSLVIPVWAASLLIVTASLMVGHWVTLPHPAVGATVPVSGMDRVSGRVEPQSLYAFHFLYGDCPCSRRVLKHVVNRKPVPGVGEHLVLIGRDEEMQRRAESKGFSVDTIEPEELKRIYGVDAVPLLVVTNGDGGIHYSGGYTPRKQGLDIQDESIIRQAMDGEMSGTLPLYGCAVSKSLKSIVDPLNIK